MIYGMENAGVDIELSGVGLTYRSGEGAIEALCDVSFTVQAGESVALIGPSGCGKSTMLHVVAGLLEPSVGEVLVGGHTLEGPRRATAFIQQDLGLFPWKTAIHNIAVGLTVRKVAKAEALERARRALESVGLAGFERAYPKELSGGMRQRLALARALATDADLLLMDEPLSAIDALLRESLQDALLELWRDRGHTQMIVTHSIEEAVYLGQRILVFGNRPATVVAVIGNTAMGSSDYRAAAEFLARCEEVRRALSDTGAAVASSSETRAAMKGTGR